MTAYYNEIDPFPAQWLRNLIAAGHIAEGDVDERDIRDVQPDDLLGYSQCHFFAGIGVWSYSLRLAGWPDDQPVWTGSCPCQPFSSAGKRGGVTDDRHLWPEFFRLIAECRPPVVFGEQVASKDGLAWLDIVQTDMEGADYAFGAVDSCAAGVGAPHIRQRLYFVADAPVLRRERRGAAEGTTVQGQCSERGGEHEEPGQAGELPGGPEGLCGAGIALGDAIGSGLEGWRLLAERARERFAGQDGVAGFWAGADWIYCRDEKYRPVEPGTFPLAHGATSRVGRLRAYGNSLVAPLAHEVIAAYMDCYPA